MESMNAVVLVVDDDPQIRSVFTDYLEAFDVRTAESGSAAIEAMDHDVDVVLLDRRMPGMSGEELLTTLRENDYDQPIAMVTAVEPDFDVLGMGFDDYVVKPVFEEDLRNLVETMLLRREYDAVIREYFALVSKVTALKREKGPSALAGDERYEASQSRLEEIKQEARNALDAAIESGKFDELFLDHSDGNAEFDPETERTDTPDP